MHTQTGVIQKASCKCSVLLYKEKLLYTANQSKLIEILLSTIKDNGVLSLIQKFLNVGITDKGMFINKKQKRRSSKGDYAKLSTIPLVVSKFVFIETITSALINFLNGSSNLSSLTFRFIASRISSWSSLTKYFNRSIYTTTCFSWYFFPCVPAYLDLSNYIHKNFFF